MNTSERHPASTAAESDADFGPSAGSGGGAANRRTRLRFVRRGNADHGPGELSAPRLPLRAHSVVRVFAFGYDTRIFVFGALGLTTAATVTRHLEVALRRGGRVTVDLTDARLEDRGALAALLAARHRRSESCWS